MVEVALEIVKYARYSDAESLRAASLPTLVVHLCHRRRAATKTPQLPPRQQLPAAAVAEKERVE